MLFSNAAIASFINDNFEPAWESVRPVPIVNIDFGDATVTRTLHGNIATYLCTAEGNVLDILPGAYDANTYLTQLRRFYALGREIDTNEQPSEQLRKYHAGQAANRHGIELQTIELTEEQLERSQQAVARLADSSKVAIIERPIEAVLKSDPSAKLRMSLRRDANYNEGHRRRQIHEHLAQANWTTPQSLTKWLYREVLNTDLDDPYLGTKDLLFADYPFAEEDQ